MLAQATMRPSAATNPAGIHGKRLLTPPSVNRPEARTKIASSTDGAAVGATTAPTSPRKIT
jgi:hypothetical protein